MSSEKSLLGSNGGSPMIGVKIDRCCNRYWRLFFFLGLVVLSLVVAGTLLKPSTEEKELINSEWRDHWSESQSSDQAKKTVLEQQGRNVVETEETFGDYVEEMKGDEDIMDDSNEYYDVDSPDRTRGSSDYFNQAMYDQEAGGRLKVNPAPLGTVPEINDYSLKSSFRYMFRQPLTETIKLDSHYRNPCWAESIPQYPYRTNSYLTVSGQARVLEPQFQKMRRVFATRNATGDRWRLRCLPYYYVMETPPRAVPSLFTVLGYHPFVVNPAMSEPEFWNLRGPDNIAKLQDYLDIFDNAAESIRANTTNVEKDGKMEMMHKKVTGDGTSSYIWTIDNWKNLPGNENMAEPKITTADLIKSLTPTAKIILVLRNPTERLFQGYLQRADDPSAADFHEKVGQAMEAMSKCVEARTFRSCVYDSQLNKRLKVRLRIGMYYPFVEDYIKVFGKEQVKVIRYEDYISSTSKIINEACAFLGLMPYPTQDLEKAEGQVQAIEKKRRETAKVQMLSSTRAMLKEFHKVLNEKLAEILDDEAFTWPEQILDAATLDDASNQYQKQQEKRKQNAEQQPQGAGQSTGAASDNRPKTFQEMLEKIRRRQRQALEMQNKLRQQQMERLQQMRREKEQQSQQGQAGAQQQNNWASNQQQQQQRQQQQQGQNDYGHSQNQQQQQNRKIQEEKLQTQQPKQSPQQQPVGVQQQQQPVGVQQQKPVGVQQQQPVGVQQQQPVGVQQQQPVGVQQQQPVGVQQQQRPKQM